MASPILAVERLRELLEYNPETGVFVWLVTRGKARCGEPVTKRHPDGYIWTRLDGSRLYMAHRLAWLYTHGEWPKGQIDHINGVKDDNRIANLRDVTPAQNSQNRHRHNSTSSTGVLGVWPSRSKRLPWTSSIRFNGKCVCLGCFATQESAQAAYLEAKSKFHIFSG